MSELRGLLGARPPNPVVAFAAFVVGVFLVALVVEGLTTACLAAASSS